MCIRDRKKGGLKINYNKTKYMEITRTRLLDNTNAIQNHEFENASEFSHLGSQINYINTISIYPSENWIRLLKINGV